MQSAVIPTAITSVRLSVRLSHAGTLSRRMNIGSCGLHCEVAKTLNKVIMVINVLYLILYLFRCRIIAVLSELLGSAVERRSLAGELSLSCAPPIAKE